MSILIYILQVITSPHANNAWICAEVFKSVEELKETAIDSVLGGKMATQPVELLLFCFV